MLTKTSYEQKLIILNVNYLVSFLYNCCKEQQNTRLMHVLSRCITKDIIYEQLPYYKAWPNTHNCGPEICVIDI